MRLLVETLLTILIIISGKWSRHSSGKWRQCEANLSENTFCYRGAAEGSRKRSRGNIREKLCQRKYHRNITESITDISQTISGGWRKRRGKRTKLCHRRHHCHPPSERGSAEHKCWWGCCQTQKKVAAGWGEWNLLNFYQVKRWEWVEKATKRGRCSRPEKGLSFISIPPLLLTLDLLCENIALFDKIFSFAIVT